MPEIEIQPQPNLTPVVPSNKNKILIIILSIVTIVLLVVISILLFLLLSKNNGSSDKQTSLVTNTPIATATKGVTETVKQIVASASPSSPSVTATAKLAKVSVYFSKEGSEYKVFPVDRYTERVDVAAFSMEQYISGPTAAEKAQGYTNNINLSGTSDCSGKDFTITITNGKAVFRLCREISLVGIGTDALLSMAIESNLKQFSSVTSVVILNKSNNCLFDYSGLNQCGQ
ncbi:MAG: hypothetical protein WCJ19_00620 [bacterium]